MDAHWDTSASPSSLDPSCCPSHWATTALNDPEFLLRCASTHDWDNVIRFCGFIEDLFSSTARRHRLTAAKRQLVAQDQWGNTALHAACYNNCPVRVVTSLLTAARVAKLNIHVILSRDHSSPLLVACATGACLPVIQALLDPPSGNKLVTCADQQGGTPLSELVVHYELTRKTPVHVHRSVPLDRVERVASANSHHENNPTLLDTFWSKVDALLHAAATTPQQHFNNDNHHWTSALHSAAMVCESSPPELTKLIIRSWPHMVSQVDHDGLLPLHLALSKPKARPQSSLPLPLPLRRTVFVQTLLEAHPQAARVPLPTTHRMPLCHAILSGLHWHASTTARGPLCYLVQAAPEVLSMPDAETGLVPALLAAIIRTKQNDNDAFRLDTIYSLLRQYPQIIPEQLDVMKFR